MHRLARRGDLGDLKTLMDAAIAELQKPFLTESQIASSRVIMGLDTQLIDDGTYYVVESDGELAGCGGWSRRATLYGGDQTPGRSAVLLDPAKEAARIRAMYTHPRHVRKGVGRLIISVCEDAREPKVSGESSSWRPSPANPFIGCAATNPWKTSRTIAVGIPYR